MQVVNESHIYTDPVSEAFCPKCGEALGVEGLPAFTSVECPKCSHVFQVPAHFGPFLLIELLGAGGMGGVYRAKDEGLNREVAIKVMLQSLGDDIDFVETFQREAQAAAKLNNPHIAQIYSFGQQYGQPYIVMEIVSHGSLEEMMNEKGGVEPALAVLVAEQIAEGLREAAEAGLVHGDVKPENILFDEEGNAKLVDFGLVALSSGNANEVWGTPFYIAPEKVRRQKADYRSDIYSLGATLYHAIANQPPFDGPDATAVVKARFEGPPKPLSEVTGKEIPPEVEALVQRMLEVDPAKRYPTYGSLLGDMKRYLTKAGPVSLKKSSRRIKIKGKQSVKFERKKASVTGKVSADDNGGAEKVVVQDSVQSQGCKKMAKVGCFVALGLMVLGGIIAGVVVMKVKKAAETAIAQMHASQDKAVATGAKAVDIAKKNSTKIKKLAPDAIRYADDAAKLAVTVLGEDVRPRMVPPEPEYKMPAVKAITLLDDIVSSNTNSVDAADEAAGEPVVEEVPAGEMPNENDHPVVTTVRQMYMEAYAVKRAGIVADHVVAELEATQTHLESLKSSPLATGKFDPLKDNPAVVATMAKLASEMSQRVNSMSFLPEIKEAPRKLSNLKTTLSTVKTDLDSLVVQKRLEEAEKERLVRKAAEEAKKQAEREALKEKVMNEKARIAVAEGECIEAIQNLRFSEAIRTLGGVADELETDHGGVALMTAKERIKRIEEFHKYLVKYAPGYKFSKGGTITAADEKRLTVGKTKMFWKEFYLERFKEAGEFIAMSVNHPDVKKGMSIREHTRLMTNTALFLYVFYPEMPEAQKFARKLANDAVKQFDVDADIIKGLLPQFFEEGEGL